MCQGWGHGGDKIDDPEPQDSRSGESCWERDETRVCDGPRGWVAREGLSPEVTEELILGGGGRGRQSGERAVE